MLRSILVSTLLLALTPAVAAQTGTLDQVSPLFLDGLDISSATGASLQQDFEVGIGGQLEGVTLKVASPVNADQATVRLYAGAGPHGPGSVPLFVTQVQSVGNAPTLRFLDMSAANVLAAVGDVLCIEVVADSQAMRLTFNSAFAQPLYGSPAYIEVPAGSWSALFIERVGFQSWMLPTPGPGLGVSGSCPTQLTLTVQNATPGGRVGFGYALFPGATVLQNGACAGTVIDLVNPQVVAVIYADGSGTASVSGSVPPLFGCGLLLAQALDVGSCTTTNTVVL